MQHPFEHIGNFFKGRFITEPVQLAEKLKRIKAYIFDWDGVFNDGYKNETGSSPFSEIDSMGTNLLRFNHYLRTGANPLFGIITGEKNPAAFTLANREHFHSVYFRIKNKQEALSHFCDQHKILPQEVAFVFDDVLDLSATRVAGLRVMVPHAANSLLLEFALKQGLVDYITYHDGCSHAVRETTDLLMTLSDQYENTIQHRMDFSASYQEYLDKRQLIVPVFFTKESSLFTQSAQS